MPMPIEWVEVVQAVTTARFGPVMPYMIDRWPEIMLMMLPGRRTAKSCVGVFVSRYLA